MFDILKDMRAFANRELSESAFKAETMANSGYDFENDEEFMQECVSACLGTFLSMEILGEAADAMDEATKDAFIKVQDYLVGQGVITEAATVNINNPKVNFVKLSRKAQLSRLTSIITLKMARKAGSPNFKKYKIGMRIKKENMNAMREKYGKQAEKLAQKVMRSRSKRGKVAAVVDNAKSKAGTKK